MKGNIGREDKRRTKLIMDSRLNGKNKTITRNTWTVSLMRNGTDFVKWTKRKLVEIDRKTIKAMTMNKKLQPVSDVDRLYVSRMEMEGGRGLTGCKMLVKVEENSLGCYVKHHIEILIVAVRISNTVHGENFLQPKKKKK